MHFINLNPLLNGAAWTSSDGENPPQFVMPRKADRAWVCCPLCSSMRRYRLPQGLREHLYVAPGAQALAQVLRRKVHEAEDEAWYLRML